jgi:hypothetical protein
LLFANVTFFKECYEVTLSWHFLAISQGKDVADGTIKLAVWTTRKVGQHAHLEVLDQIWNAIFPSSKDQQHPCY